MLNIVEEIQQSDGAELELILKAVRQRYAVLYPDWEVSTISLLKTSDRNEQLDRIIAMLQNMKTFS